MEHSDGQQPDQHPTRRDVLRSAAGAAGAAAAGGMGLPILAVGGQDDTRDRVGQTGSAQDDGQDAGGHAERVIPADKGFSKRAIAKLYERGRQRVYQGGARKTIGMPCGGICAGQLYVRGDGTLGYWGIDGHHRFTGYGRDNYRTYRPEHVIRQGFAVRAVSDDRETSSAVLSDDGYDAIEFVGEYPRAQVAYRAAEKTVPPLDVDLEVFSPFVPLNARASAHPATVLHFTVKNTSQTRQRVTLVGWLENMVYRGVELAFDHQRRNRRMAANGLLSVFMDAFERPEAEAPEKPRTRVIADFESGTYEGWTVTGDAFGDQPAAGTLANQQTVSGFQGKHLANSFGEGDRPKGRMVSDPFNIDLPLLSFLIGGGRHAGQTCMNLIVDGKAVRTAAGNNNERLERRVWDVREFIGRDAHLDIVDERAGGWGHVNVDHIALTNRLPDDLNAVGEKSLGFGNMALSLIGEGRAHVNWPGLDAWGDAAPTGGREGQPAQAMVALRDALSGAVETTFELEPGDAHDAVFIVSWFFPNLHTKSGVMYANWFRDARDVARQLAANLERLRSETLLFCDAYYRETTLPWWLASRLMMPLSTLATGTCQWWKSGRFWGWEGVGCCDGTCTHVWNYAQGHARLFPELARSTRSMQDLGQAFDPGSGLVGFRSNRAYAADGQAGTVLKCYREHLTSPDDRFLETHWPRIKLALEYLIRQDDNADGVIENSQHNTYDINFVGANTFVGSLYLAALRAAEEMAKQMNDTDAAARYRKLFQSGSRWSAENLYNGEYFEQRLPDRSTGRWQYGNGCLSDQVFGQNWAHGLGLGYIYPADTVRGALRSVYTYNWAPDVGRASKLFKPERWFAQAGEGGLFTCTWPRGGRHELPVRYRNEVWTGIEYQVAAGMVWEGLTDEALTMIRALDERYDGRKHNPFNEVECGDHYARALASWGVYLALAGFNYDGPGGRMTIAPRITPDRFACLFTAAEGWGTIGQRREGRSQENSIDLKAGKLRLTELSTVARSATDEPLGRAAVRVQATVVNLRETTPTPRRVAARVASDDGREVVRFEDELSMIAGERLSVTLSW